MCSHICKSPWLDIIPLDDDTYDYKLTKQNSSKKRKLRAPVGLKGTTFCVHFLSFYLSILQIVNTKLVSLCSKYIFEGLLKQNIKGDILIYIWTKKNLKG